MFYYHTFEQDTLYALIHHRFIPRRQVTNRTALIVLNMIRDPSARDKHIGKYSRVFGSSHIIPPSLLLIAVQNMNATPSHVWSRTLSLLRPLLVLWKISATFAQWRLGRGLSPLLILLPHLADVRTWQYDPSSFSLPNSRSPSS